MGRVKKTAEEVQAELTETLKKLQERGLRPRLLPVTQGQCSVCKTGFSSVGGLCVSCFNEFSLSPEYARVKTAIADWQRRIALEKE